MSRRRALFLLINQLHLASATTQYPKQVKTSKMHIAKLLRKEKKKQNKTKNMTSYCHAEAIKGTHEKQYQPPPQTTSS
jgi:hypothetical protein